MTDRVCLFKRRKKNQSQPKTFTPYCKIHSYILRRYTRHSICMLAGKKLYKQTKVALMSLTGTGLRYLMTHEQKQKFVFLKKKQLNNEKLKKLSLLAFYSMTTRFAIKMRNQVKDEENEIIFAFTTKTIKVNCPY